MEFANYKLSENNTLLAYNGDSTYAVPWRARNSARTSCARSVFAYR
jgi:hypothetical protein